MADADAGQTAVERQERLSLVEIVLLAGFVPIAAVSWVAILLSEVGLFSGRRVWACTAAVTAVAWSAGFREFKASTRFRIAVSARTWCSLAATLAAAGILFSGPAECLIEGRDASVYVATGRTIERTGGIISADPLLAVVPAEAFRPLLTRDPAWPHVLNRFPGGIQVSPGAGRLVPNFFHLLPAWVATVSTIAGPIAAYWVNVGFGVLGVLALWLAGRRAWSPAAGGVAAALLAVSFGQVVYTRLALSEVPAQFFLLAGFGFTLVAVDTQSRVAGACAGAAIGIAGFTRIDSLALLVPMTALWLASVRRRGLLGPAWVWYAAVLALVSGHALAHALLVSTPYTLRLGAMAWTSAAGRVGAMSMPKWFGAAVCVFCVAVLALAAKRWLAARPAERSARPFWGVAGVVLTLLVLAPLVEGIAARLLSPVGAAAALAGLGVVLWRGDRARLFLLVAPFVAEVVLLAAWREPAGLSTDFRRLVPVILPAAALFVGILVAEVSTLPLRVMGVVWILPVGLGLLGLCQAWPVVWAWPMHGLESQVAALATRLPSDAVVVSDRSVPSHLALALQSTYGRVSIPVWERPPVGSFHSFIEGVLASGHPAFVMIAPYEGELPRRLWRSDFNGFDVHLAGTVPLEYRSLVPALTGMPRVFPATTTGVELYRLTHLAAGPGAELPAMIDIGKGDFASVLRGFYAPEVTESAWTRWSSGEAQVLLPEVAAGGSPLTLVLRVAAYRPPGVPAPKVRVFIDGVVVGAIDGPGPELSVFRLPLGADTSARLRVRAMTLTITSDTFVPKTAGLGNDMRVLGIVLDWIRLE
jgi:hypothetical protein